MGKINIHNVTRNDKGRYLLLDATIHNVRYTLVNVYAPNLDSPEFFRNLSNDISHYHPDYRIIGGDFNLGLDQLVDSQGKRTNNSNAAGYWNTQLNQEKWIDVWRFLHPDISGFTWRKVCPAPVFSRLDYFFVSEEFMQFVEIAEILPGFRSDHSFVRIKIAFDKAPRGPGYWQLNRLLLKDQNYIDKINRLIEIKLDQDFNSYREKWEVLKLAIRGTMIQFSTRRKKSNLNKITLIEHKLKNIDKTLHNLTINLIHDRDEYK